MKIARALAESIVGRPSQGMRRRGNEWRVQFSGGREVRVWTEGYALRAAKVQEPAPEPQPPKKKPAAKKRAAPKKKAPAKKPRKG